MTRGQAPGRGRGGQIGAVVLAAGAATRFGSPKQYLLLPRVLERLGEAPVDDVVVVAGAYPLEAAGARVVTCADWELGPGASLRCGLAALAPGAEAAVVVLADGPNLSPAAVERVLAAWRDDLAPFVAASYRATGAIRSSSRASSGSSVPDEASARSSRCSSRATTSAPPGTSTARRTSVRRKLVRPAVLIPAFVVLALGAGIGYAAWQQLDSGRAEANKAILDSLPPYPGAREIRAHYADPDRR